MKKIPLLLLLLLAISVSAAQFRLTYYRRAALLHTGGGAYSFTNTQQDVLFITGVHATNNIGGNRVIFSSVTVDGDSILVTWTNTIPGAQIEFTQPISLLSNQVFTMTAGTNLNISNNLVQLYLAIPSR